VDLEHALLAGLASTVARRLIGDLLCLEHADGLAELMLRPATDS